MDSSYLFLDYPEVDYSSHYSLPKTSSSILIPRSSNKEQQISPDTVISTTNASNFDYFKGDINTNTTERNPDIVQFLKVSFSHDH